MDADWIPGEIDIGDQDILILVEVILYEWLLHALILERHVRFGVGRLCDECCVTSRVRRMDVFWKF